jgi:hypothetical protein
MYFTLHLYAYEICEGLQYLSRAPGFTPICGVRVTHHFSFLWVLFPLACLRPVSCVPNVVSVTGLSILDCYSNLEVILILIE